MEIIRSVFAFFAISRGEIRRNDSPRKNTEIAKEAGAGNAVWPPFILYIHVKCSRPSWRWAAFRASLPVYPAGGKRGCDDSPRKNTGIAKWVERFTTDGTDDTDIGGAGDESFLSGSETWRPLRLCEKHAGSYPCHPSHPWFSAPNPEPASVLIRVISGQFRNFVISRGEFSLNALLKASLP
jgi:hypothetical protein